MNFEIYDVVVKISAAKPIGKAPFGYPLILNIGEAKDYEVFYSLADVAEAGYTPKTTGGTDGVYEAAALMFSQENPPEKIAIMGIANTDNIALDLADKDCRQIVALGAAKADIEAISTYVNTTSDKMYFATSTLENIADVPDGKRTVHFVHDNPIAVAAFVGESAGRTVGSFNYKCLILNGIDPMPYGKAELTTIHEANAITFVNKAGDNVTSEATTTNGDFIDIIDIQDYAVTQITYRTQRKLNTVAKIPYDDTGIAQLENVAVTVMKEMYAMGIIATVDNVADYTVNYAKRAETTEDERATREYNGGRFSFTAAGAISYAKINGTILF